MSMNRRTIIAGIGAALALSGCASVVRPPLTYDLGMPQLPRAPRRVSKAIVITLPKAVSTYETERVVVREAGGVLSYLPEAQWSDRLPKLLQTRLLQALQYAGFLNIGRPDDQLSVDVTLATEIMAFEIDVSQGAIASVSIAAKLVDERRGKIYASTILSATSQGSVEDGRAAIAGLDAALGSVSKQLLDWVLENA